MNIETNLVFSPKDEAGYICKKVLLDSDSPLAKSRKLKRYQISTREVFGLYILSEYRKFIEPRKEWIFTTEENISDDGAVGVLNENTISYYEKIEQVYLPGKFLKKQENKSFVENLMDHLNNTKNKGSEYFKDTSLFILNDISSTDSNDYFDWKDFAEQFFEKLPFLHVYFLGLTSQRYLHNTYYLFSFTDQKHRQNLNGEFTFDIKIEGISNFKCLQKINLLDKTKNVTRTP